MNYKFCTKKLRMKMRMRMNINKDFFNNIIKMSYYHFNRQEILQKAK